MREFQTENFKGMVAGKDRKEYFRQYNREKRIIISLNLSKENDMDIIEAIEKEGGRSKASAVRNLIRKSIR